MSEYYPIAVNLNGQRCLVVGGGSVAFRKIETLLDCGACVKVVSPQVLPEIESLSETGRIDLLKREYQVSDIDGAILIVAATDDAAVNAEVSNDAKRANILINVVDRPELCNFIVPATVRRGDLTLAIFTAGKSPALAKKIRKQLEDQFGPEYGLLVNLLGEMREEVKRKYENQKDREAVLYRVLDAELLEDLRAGNLEEAKRKAFECI